MSILVCLLVIIGTPWLSDAMTEFRKSHGGRLVPYVKKPAGVMKNAQICYCIGSTCYYCPTGTYCNLDRTGCCPRPGCRNHCGIWCLCPGYPICCPDGACPGSYPKCCGKVCCRSDGNCCERKHCCDAQSSCCGKGCCPKDNGKCCTTKSKETFCCTKKNLKLEDGDRRNDEEDEEGLRLEVRNVDDENIFKDLCETFKASGQYAVLVVGRLSSTYKLQPTPKPSPYNSQGLSIGDNYAAAKFKSGGKHTEDIILGYADDMINKYKGKYGKNPELFLFSKNSPCCGSPLSPDCNAGCAGKIRAKLTELSGTITSMIIAWDNNYKLGAMPFDKAFLFSLNSMLSPGNARLSWNTNGYCRKTPRKWFQEAMLGCLSQTAKAHPFCTSAIVENDLARLINKVTWECGTSSSAEDDYNPDQLVYDDEETFDSKTLGSPPSRNPGCWKSKVSSLDHYSCSQLPEKAYECATQYGSNDLGPALNPSNPTTFSNSASDVRGDYGKLCFESGSCKAPSDSLARSYEGTDNRPEDEL